MQEQSKQRRMTMDFSQLHTYAPPQCAPENTGYTYSLSSSYSTAALEFEKEHQIAPVYESPRMSRRSLRLQTVTGHHGNNSLMDYTQKQSSYTTRKESRTLRSRKLHSSSNAMSLSLSQAGTPGRDLSFSAVSTPINSATMVEESHAAFDVGPHATAAADQARLRQRTVTASVTTTTVDGIWGRSSHSERNSSSVNGDVAASNGYICKDCSFHSQSSESLVAHSSQMSSSSSHAAEACTDALSYSSSPFTSIYSRDRSRKSKTGVLALVSNSCARLSKKVMAPFVSILATVCSGVLWLRTRTKSGTQSAGVLASCTDSLRQTASSGLSQVWLLQRRMKGDSSQDSQVQAHSSYCGSVNVKDVVTGDSSHLNLNGSLCDDCKGKQHSSTHAVPLTRSSRSRRLAGALWSLLAGAGSCLLQPGHWAVKGAQSLGSGAGALAQGLLAVLWAILAAPVKTGRGLLWFLVCGWYHLVSLMSVVNVFVLTRCLPLLWKLLLLLLPLLLLLALWLWGPSSASLVGFLPAVNLSEWRASSPVAYLSKLLPESALESLLGQPLPPVSQTLPIVVPGVDLTRLERLERQLALLWERVQQSDQKQEEHHTSILALYKSLREKLHAETDRETLELWTASLLEQRLAVVRGELKQDQARREQSEEQLKAFQGSQTTRLADLELLLDALAAKTKEVEEKQQQYELHKKKTEQVVVAPTVDSPVSSVGVKQEEHDALLGEVQRLELDLGKIRQDLQGVLGCKGKCEQLDSLQETITTQVSSQVRKELQVLFFGGVAQGELPESLVLWLSRRYVSAPDLRASLAALERGILGNVSRQLELNRAQTVGEAEVKAASVAGAVTGSVQSVASTEGLSEEQVNVIVQNALRLYSQDRTGLVDYALESGGGSILSTRCSETHETKTALMSLFGVPLWYFSQSPRVVIQPDVYPGNCWAFKGSQGYLVIRLSMRIRPTSFCLEHIPKALSPTGNITSAPQNFTVFGLDDEYQEEGQLLGHYTYQEAGESLQTFPVKEPTEKSFQIMEVHVLSNWGHPDYTCLYRFRVHGEPRPQ
ncbi:SUN domain-containing protein 1 isoform X2 [Syngnathoides biaculeatus]|uniref:SUN domain-containing protein 1 isoform X2 n=1 Tax=Syngnathoides biaculeatus TaxID=300417 RepID=UPI002ADE1665|nr:SUN domain-containing protein 1 isoform X2 [Syngnathoides biaculeatus]